MKWRNSNNYYFFILFISPFIMNWMKSVSEQKIEIKFNYRHKINGNSPRKSCNFGNSERGSTWRWVIGKIVTTKKAARARKQKYFGRSSCKLILYIANDWILTLLPPTVDLQMHLGAELHSDVSSISRLVWVRTRGNRNFMLKQLEDTRIFL